jgi:hypothetical protein
MISSCRLGPRTGTLQERRRSRPELIDIHREIRRVESGGRAPTSPSKGADRAPEDEPEDEKEADMKYVALIYSNPGAFDALSEEERERFGAEADAYIKELEGTGELVGGAALADIEQTKVVRVRDGVAATTDGPFAEAKEQLAGYYVLDVESIDRAAELVAKDPAARVWAIELRPVMDEAGTEM